MDSLNCLKSMWNGLDKKVRKYILIICLITLGMAGVTYISGSKQEKITEADLAIPDAGQESVSVPVEIHLRHKDGTVSKFNKVLELFARDYTEEQAKAIMDEAGLKLDNLILKSNSSLTGVHSDLELVEYIEGTPVTVSWYSSDYELIDEEGNVNNYGFSEGEERHIDLYALLKCGEYSSEKIFNVVVIDRTDSDNKSFLRESNMYAVIDRYIDDCIKDANGEYVQLPSQYKDSELEYYKQTSNDSGIWLILGGSSVAALIAGDGRQKKQRRAERIKELKLDYCEIVSKISMLLGAGMTMRKVWEKIVLDYNAIKKAKGGKFKNRAAYEEMAESVNQMRAGIAEVRVYEEFGARCGIREYQKLSTLIVQNLTKGSKDLRELLALEVVDAFEQKKNLTRIKGEEAGTKLLFPMILMLVIVMVIVIVPAFMSFEL